MFSSVFRSQLLQECGPMQQPLLVLTTLTEVDDKSNIKNK